MPCLKECTGSSPTCFLLFHFGAFRLKMSFCKRGQKWENVPSAECWGEERGSWWRVSSGEVSQTLQSSFFFITKEPSFSWWWPNWIKQPISAGWEFLFLRPSNTPPHPPTHPPQQVTIQMVRIRSAEEANGSTWHQTMSNGSLGG